MDNDQEQLLPARRDLAARRWVVCAEGEFGESVVADLAAIGVTVDHVDRPAATPTSRARWGLWPAPATTQSTSPRRTRSPHEP